MNVVDFWRCELLGIVNFWELLTFGGWEDLLPFLTDVIGGQTNPTTDESRAKDMFFLPAMESECVFQKTKKHIVKRSGFNLTHAFYLTETTAQGQTIDTNNPLPYARKTGVVVTLAQPEPQPVSTIGRVPAVT